MMLECICCQCSERPGQFKNYAQCIDCGLYGNEDEFSGDKNGEMCNRCALDRHTTKIDKVYDERMGK